MDCAMPRLDRGVLTFTKVMRLPATAIRRIYTVGDTTKIVTDRGTYDAYEDEYEFRAVLPAKFNNNEHQMELAL